MKDALFIICQSKLINTYEVSLTRRVQKINTLDDVGDFKLELEVNKYN